MNILNMFDKLDDIIYEPVKAITDWAKEPLKAFENRRKKKMASHLAELEKNKAEHQAKLEKEKEEHKVNMQVKKETEVKKVLAELDDWQKDKELQRAEKLINSIAAYKERLLNLNLEAHKAIGNMELDLQERAKKFVYENTIKYTELQEKTRDKAFSFLERIEKFEGNEKTKERLQDEVFKMLGNIIDNADDFVKTLNNEMVALSNSIIELAHSGEKYIENHIEQISIATSNNIKKIDLKSDDISDANIVD